MLLRRPLVHVALGREGRPSRLRAAQVPHHGLAVDALLDAQVHAGPRARVEQVVALVLRVVHPEAVLDVLGERVDLEREVPAAHRVQEVEPDRELVPEARVDGLAEELARVAEDEVDRRHLDPRPAEPEEQAVLLRHAVEAPGVVRGLAGQVADLLHPLPAPGTGVEEGHHAEGPLHRGREAVPEVVAGDHLRSLRVVRVEQPVDPVEERALQAVGRPPVHEEAPLVELPRPLLLVVGPEARRPRPAAAAAGSPSARGPRRRGRPARRGEWPPSPRRAPGRWRLVDPAALDRGAARRRRSRRPRRPFMRPKTGSSPRNGAHIRSTSVASLYACRASTTRAGRRPAVSTLRTSSTWTPG